MSIILRAIGILKLASSCWAAWSVWQAGSSSPFIGQQSILVMGAAALAEGIVICVICFALATILNLLDEMEWRSRRAASAPISK